MKTATERSRLAVSDREFDAKAAVRPGLDRCRTCTGPARERPRGLVQPGHCRAWYGVGDSENKQDGNQPQASHMSGGGADDCSAAARLMTLKGETTATNWIAERGRRQTPCFSHWATGRTPTPSGCWMASATDDGAARKNCVGRAARGCTVWLRFGVSRLRHVICRLLVASSGVVSAMHSALACGPIPSAPPSRARPAVCTCAVPLLREIQWRSAFQ